MGVASWSGDAKLAYRLLKESAGALCASMAPWFGVWGVGKVSRPRAVVHGPWRELSAAPNKRTRDQEKGESH